VTFKNLFFGAAVAALAAFSPAAHAATNLLVNGNFEAGPTGGVIPGWNLAGITDPNSILVLKGGDYGLCCSASGSAAALANQFASFGPGDSQNSPAQLFQSYGTSAGQKRLSFDYGSIGGASHHLNYFVVDGFSGSILTQGRVTASSTSNFDALFSPFSVDYVSIGTAEQVIFTSFDGTTSKDFLLDNVSIAAVPEPASWALMIMGFGLVGSAMRRRQSVRVTYA
jgi:PEP-CTERM motif